MVKNIHAVGRNYVAHIKELGNEIPDEAILFSKSPSCLTTASQLSFPPSVGAVHHELELVLEMGRAVAVGERVGLESVRRLAMGIDFTARSLQSHYKGKGLPWHRAKNFRDACWLGPLSAVDPQQDFRFQLFVNDVLVQEGDSRCMIYPLSDLPAIISATIPLEEGDLIYSGTPAGVGPVQSGDQLRVVCAQLQTDLRLSIS